MAPSTHGQGVCGLLDAVRRPLRRAPASSDQQVLGLAAAWGKRTAEAGGQAWGGRAHLAAGPDSPRALQSFPRSDFPPQFLSFVLG